ncbi:MAG TPA: hypothetical protein VHF67_13105 [Gaiellaceae bacterium]|nr:hypothetical protein [Gaiellaceae bacterium]
MALEVTLVLHELHCVKESEEGSEPYIWPVLLWVDDTTIHNQGDDVLGVRGPVLGDARVVLKARMSGGETAPIPFPLGTLGVRLLEASMFSYVLLVVALFDRDETPQAAMWAGCKAFASELRTAIAQRLPYLKAAIAQGDDAELQRLIEEIKIQVKAATNSATWNELTGWQKTRVVLGTLNLDDYVGFAFYFGKPAPAELELVLRSDNGSEEYRINGSVDARPATIDVCQAQAVVDGIEGLISAAKAGYQDASSAGKAAISSQIKQLNQDLDVAIAALGEARRAQDLDVAIAALGEARRALQRCRHRWAELAEIRSGSAVEGVVNPSRDRVTARSSLDTDRDRIKQI